MTEKTAAGGQPFGVQFKEAINVLKGKLPEATLKWDDLAGPVHSKVFAIAGATNIDLVADIQKSLVDALEKGTTITQFRKDFDVAVQKYGWTYNGKRGWRTGVIFNNNMRSAHMAGRWQQLIANQERRPYLQYRTAGDSRVRPQHKAWNGLVYLISDDFWKTHYPPNGWGCRCTVRAYSASDLDNEELAVSKPINGKTREAVTQDGEITDQVPVGIDPGWDHNVGQSWIAPEVALGEKIGRLPRPLQGIMADKAVSPVFQKVLNDNFKAFRAATVKPSGQAQVVGYMDSGMINAVSQALPNLELQSTSVMVLDSKTNHLAGGHKAQSQQMWPAEWVDNLPEHFRNYRAVLWDKVNESLVVIPHGTFNKTLPKIVVRLNQRTKFGKSASVVSLGSTDALSLQEAAAYELLLGTVGP